MAEEGPQELFPETGAATPAPASEATYLDYSSTSNGTSKATYAAITVAMLVFALVGGYFTMKFFSAGGGLTAAPTTSVTSDNQGAVQPPQAPQYDNPQLFTADPNASVPESAGPGPLTPVPSGGHSSMETITSNPSQPSQTAPPPGLPTVVQPSSPGNPSQPTLPTGQPSTSPSPTGPATPTGPRPQQRPPVMSIADAQRSGSGAAARMHEGDLVSAIEAVKKGAVASSSLALLSTNEGNHRLSVSNGRTALVNLQANVNLGSTPPATASVLQLQSPRGFLSGATTWLDLRIEKESWVLYARNGAELAQVRTEAGPVSLPYTQSKAVQVVWEFSLAGGQLTSSITVEGQQLFQGSLPTPMVQQIRMMSGLSTVSGKKGSSAVSATYHFTKATVNDAG